MSIRMRLTIWYSSVLAVTLLLFGLGIYFFLNYYVYHNMLETTLKSQTERVASRSQLNLSLTLKGMDINLRLEDRDFRSTNTFIQVYNLTNGKVTRSASLVQFDLYLPEPTEQTKRLAETEPFFFEKVSTDWGKLLVYNIPLKTVVDGQEKAVGLFQGAIPIDTYEQFFLTLRYILAFLALLTVMLASTLGWFMSRKALSPIEQVINAANRIEGSTDLNKRIYYDGPSDEIGRLTTTINGMLSRIEIVYSELQEAYSAQRRFVSDASHELRTPLTTIRGNVDLLEKMWRQTIDNASIANSDQMQMSLEAMQDIAGEAKRMSTLIGDLLSLARSDAGVTMQMEPIELRSLVEETARRTQFLPRTAEWRLGDLSALEGAVMEGNPDYIQQLLFIFIENAFKYTPQGYVTLDALYKEDFAGIRIADTGIGMDKEEIPHIFERFYRADPSRGKTSGTGLGLSIAKWIIDEHGGSIEVTTRKDEGTTFIVWLPVTFPHLLQ